VGPHRDACITIIAYVNVFQLGMIRSDWISESSYQQGRRF